MNLQDFYKLIGQKLKYFRKQKGYTQEKLAEITGLSADYIGKIEININNPGLIALFTLITTLDVSFEEFFKDM